MATEKTVTADSWFDEYDKPANENDKSDYFKMPLKEGQLIRIENIIFQSEGGKQEGKFGKGIQFQITHEGRELIWFIKENQWSLLNPIAKVKKSGLLKGRTAEVQRTGEKKDTRWGIVFK